MHTPRQSWVPLGHSLEQASVSGMHSPAHGCWPLGQVGRHRVPSQSTLPPVGATQGSQDIPQLSGDMLSAQASAHWCVPSGQRQSPSTHAPPTGQSSSVQQLDSGMQALPQDLVPSLQMHM
jgi:hypothetical protein